MVKIKKILINLESNYQNTAFRTSSHCRAETRGVRKRLFPRLIRKLVVLHPSKYAWVFQRHTEIIRIG